LLAADDYLGSRIQRLAALHALQQGISTVAAAITTGLSEAEVKQLKEVYPKQH